MPANPPRATISRTLYSLLSSASSFGEIPADPVNDPSQKKTLSVMGRSIMGLSSLGWSLVLTKPPEPPLIIEDELANFVTTCLGVDCFPLKIPEDVTPDQFPLFRYSVVDSQSILDLSGATGLASINVQFDCYSPQFADALAMSNQLYQLLGSLRGQMGGAVVQGATRVRNTSNYTPPAENSDRGMYGYMSEYSIWYHLPVPRF